jgi:hypothetical protein
MGGSMEKDKDRSLVPTTIADIPKNKLGAMAKKEGGKADRLRKVARGVFATCVVLIFLAPILTPPVLILIPVMKATGLLFPFLGTTGLLIAGDVMASIHTRGKVNLLGLGDRLVDLLGMKDNGEYQAGERVTAFPKAVAEPIREVSVTNALVSEPSPGPEAAKTVEEPISAQTVQTLLALGVDVNATYHVATDDPRFAPLSPSRSVKGKKLPSPGPA